MQSSQLQYAEIGQHLMTHKETQMDYQFTNTATKYLHKLSQSDHFRFVYLTNFFHFRWKHIQWERHEDNFGS